MKSLHQKGYTALFAVLISSLVLAVGIGIINITLKEITLSAAGRDSQFAFYAADTGAECAMYWDLKGSNIFATSSNSSVAPLNCLGTTVTPTISQSNNSSATSTFTIQFSDEAYCSNVNVAKYDNDGDGISEITVIDSRGYNTCDTNNKNRLERGLRITY